MKITTAIIVRNEERSIKRCILSVLPYTDEVIIIDTGSTDNTISLITGISSNKINYIKYPGATISLRPGTKPLRLLPELIFSL